MSSDIQKLDRSYPRSPVDADEIDVIDVLRKIWQGKVLIAVIVLISSALTFVVLSLLPSYYKVEATIDAISAIQLRPVSPSILSNIGGSHVSALEYQVPALDEKKIYDRVILQVNSLALLKDFWEKKTGKILDLTPGAASTDELREFKKFYKKFVLETPNAKLSDVTARKVSVESKSPNDGVTLLNSYLEFVNQQVCLELLQKLEVSYSANIKALTVSYNARNLIEQQALSDYLLKLRENIKVAQSLGIKEIPFKSLENIQLRILDSQEYLLGTKSLAEQVDILVARQAKSLASYSPDLRNMEIWLTQMNADLSRIKEIDGKIRLFSVVNRPTSSMDPVAPKKPLIFIALVFLSGILGVIVVLVNSGIQERNSRVK
jgi:chain length determinant protein (polysaccharide antigen chain regulator)